MSNFEFTSFFECIFVFCSGNSHSVLLLYLVFCTALFFCLASNVDVKDSSPTNTSLQLCFVDVEKHVSCHFDNITAKVFKTVFH